MDTEISKSSDWLMNSPWIFSIFQRHFLEKKYIQLRTKCAVPREALLQTLPKDFDKRRYPNALVSKLTDCDAEATETQVWIDFALDCGYLSTEKYDRLVAGYEEVWKMLSGMMANPKRFAPVQSSQPI